MRLIDGNDTLKLLWMSGHKEDETLTRKGGAAEILI